MTELSNSTPSSWTAASAILFDLGVGGRPDIRPGPDCGYQAAKAASDGPVSEGSIGAGAGAVGGAADAGG